MSIKVLKAGFLTTVQDLGRFGFAHLGISPAGAADALSVRVANLLVGNEENAAALEMTLMGASLEFDEESAIAITGAEIADANVPMWREVEVPAGFVLDCGPLKRGARSYVAVRGGITVPSVMQSASTFLAGGFGGFEGRALRNGDVLTIGKLHVGEPRQVREDIGDLIHSRGPIRVTRGLQWDWFDPAATERFLGTQYTVTPHSNRAGLRLEGTPVASSSARELVTEGISLGAIQVPANGQPIILFVDQQTTGGYPKIANVISADLHRIGQLRPGDTLSFELVTVDQAVDLLKHQEQLLREAFSG